MISRKYHRMIQVKIKYLYRYTKSAWYIPLISLLAFLDNFLIVIPNDGILLSSSVIAPRKWYWFAISMAIGSSLGAILLAFIVEQKGLPLILDYFPGIDQTQIWSWSEIFLVKYGLLFVFAIGLSPIMQHPAIILSALANTPLMNLGLVIFLGRIIKFFLMAYIASHAPNYLSQFWGMKSKMQDIELRIK